MLSIFSSLSYFFLFVFFFGHLFVINFEFRELLCYIMQAFSYDFIFFWLFLAFCLSSYEFFSDTLDSLVTENFTLKDLMICLFYMHFFMFLLFMYLYFAHVYFGGFFFDYDQCIFFADLAASFDFSF